MYGQVNYQDKLGTCASTIKQQGCFITSICNLLEYYNQRTLTPPELNQICKSKGFYVSGCSLVAPSVATYFGAAYERTLKLPDIVCIAETNNYAKLGVPSHFFLYNPKTKLRLDPLDSKPTWETNTYNIVSYRVFKFPTSSKVETVANNAPVQDNNYQDNMKPTQKLKDFYQFICGKTAGENLNNNEMDDLADKGNEKIYKLQVELDTLREKLNNATVTAHTEPITPTTTQEPVKAPSGLELLAMIISLFKK